MIRALALLLLLAGCGGPLSLLNGGGPNVAANVQAGAENRQALISQENAAPSVSIRPNARAGDIRQEQNTTRAETIQNYNAGIPPIYWIAWALSSFIFLMLDSPRHWPRQIMEAIRRK